MTVMKENSRVPSAMSLRCLQ